MLITTRLLSILFILNLCSTTGISQIKEVQEPTFIGNVEYITEEGTISLEKKKVSISSKASAALQLTGIGSVKQKIQVAGSSSPIKISLNENVQFIIKVKDNNYDPFDQIEIYNMEKRYGARKLLTGKVSNVSGASQGNINRVSFTGVKYGESSYIVTIPKISNGEYAFFVKLGDPGNNQKSAGFTLQLFSIAQFGENVVMGEKLEVGDPVMYYYGKDEWHGKIKEISDSYIVIQTSDRGKEIDRKFWNNVIEVYKIKEIPEPILLEFNSDEAKLKEYGFELNANVKCKNPYCNGILVGEKEGEAILKTTEKGLDIFKSVQFKNLVLYQDKK